MDFGKVPREEIPEIDFSLPADGAQTAATLNKSERVTTPKFYVGCAKWGRDEWIGQIYPKGTKAKDFLNQYVKQFNAIELNASFYQIPTEKTVASWKASAESYANPPFLFFPKFPRTVSHIHRLVNADTATDTFLANLQGFGKFLGPVFLQLSDNFGPAKLDVLESYLRNLPVDMRFFVELRHREWFDDLTVRAKLFTLLHELKIGSVLTDATGRRDVLHMELSTPAAFIRFVGNGQEFAFSDRDRVDSWVQRISTWLDKGLEDVYFFLHQHDEKDTPEIADYTIEQFNKHLGSKLNRVNFITKQLGMFND
ncbi:DUF72 domain-containing protein [Pedobacter duraquae]|uniref:Uncharacterized protein YecE (DUF72 family) n=1 Tax=Pedobacter duraquae TaxID=425511 RepID=A0A4V3C3M0_9SPHI|nr:DUF72 domain-containing protein [Pedobacter duraquae]TDO22588.1 uncharacterized protein YecE (DUF72 family) [Pedobacter duraquae]